jgi:hypothetical protein
VRSLFNSILDRVRRLPADPDVGNDEILQDVERIRKEVLRGREANLKKIERWLSLRGSPRDSRSCCHNFGRPSPGHYGTDTSACY